MYSVYTWERTKVGYNLEAMILISLEKLISMKVLRIENCRKGLVGCELQVKNGQ
jgi:hypothetical protein